MTAEVRRTLYGTEEAPATQRKLHAGSLTAILGDGQIGAVISDDVEIVRGIAFLVRDAQWGTVDAVIRELNIDQRRDGFTVTYAAHCGRVGDGIDYGAVIHGEAGHLTFSISAVPERDFLANRIGFVILHSLKGVVGCPMEIQHADGGQETIAIPTLITPDQPVLDIRGLAHNVFGRRVTIRMTSDSYEMEDQRNWCDAFLKTYIRPLSKPRPYVVPAGVRIEQSVNIHVLGRASDERKVPPVEPMVRKQSSGTVGRLPQIGLALDGPQIAHLSSTLEAIVELRPQHLLLRLDRPDAKAEALCRAVQPLSAASGADLSADLVLDGSAPIEELTVYAALFERTGFKAMQIMPCPKRDLKTRPTGHMPPGEASTAAILRAARTAFPNARIGGGVLTSFTEFNRNPPAADYMEFLAHSTAAIVHAADDASVLRTLEALPHVIASARQLVSGCFYRLGPSAIGVRDNPYGDGVAPNPFLRRITMTRRDPRHFVLFGAVWTLAYLAVAAAQEIDQAILGDVTGDFGVVAIESGMVVYHPLYHVLRAVARASAAQVESMKLPDGFVGASYVSPSGRELLIGNTTAVARPLPEADGFGRIARLDSVTTTEAARNPNFLDQTVPLERPISPGPYATARLVT